MQYTPVVEYCFKLKSFQLPVSQVLTLFMKCLYGIVNNLFIKCVPRWTFHTIELAMVKRCEACNVLVAPYPASLAHH